MEDKYFEANRKMWDEFAKENFKVENEYYSVKEFLNGKSTLKPFELEEMGTVKGRKILHLQCHFGLDTLSWAREGAQVTGIDFSSEAIRLAKLLADNTGLDAKFIESNIYDLRGVLHDEFDIVYT
jgi:2-polyprenyl-3-methyl-5-hydroxy-6-metoxy-1,4-benzoquinol methylase